MFVCLFFNVCVCVCVVLSGVLQIGPEDVAESHDQCSPGKPCSHPQVKQPAVLTVCVCMCMCGFLVCVAADVSDARICWHSGRYLLPAAGYS